jgi:TRAP-type uncharacterized transport system fused permease subunit
LPRSPASSSAADVGLFTSRSRTSVLQWTAVALGHAVLLRSSPDSSATYNVPRLHRHAVACRCRASCAAAESRIAGGSGRSLRDRREVRARVGAAAATVGIVIGVVTLTGVGFKLSYIVTSAAQSIAEPHRDSAVRLAERRR